MTSNGTVRDAALRYLAKGRVPVPLKGKRGFTDEWEKLRCTGYDLDGLFPVGCSLNIGVLMGEPSGGLVDVDLDCPEARAAAVVLLPHTGMMWGRKSAPDSHYGYVVDAPPVKTEQFNDPIRSKEARLLELRSTGGQTVVPPSVYPADPEDGHPEVEPCIWSAADEPARIEIGELRRRVKRVAAAVILGRYWPGGSRHHSALALGGGLIRSGFSVDDAVEMVEAVVTIAGDTDCRDRVRCVRDTAEKLNAGEKATGWPELVKLLGKDGQTIVGKLREWLGVRIVFGQPGTSSGGDGEQQTGAAIILDYYRDRYRPDFRRGNAIHTQDGEMVPKSVACDVPTSKLITLLESAVDAPRYAPASGGGVKRDQLPPFFRKWASVAWGDLLAELPDEDEAELGIDSVAADEFRAMVRNAMLSEITLGQTIGDSGLTQQMHASLIHWCEMFAKEGPWRAIRSKWCWCKKESNDKGEVVLRVAVRQALFPQLIRADKSLCLINQNTFTRRCERYGVGKSSRDDRPHGQTAVVLDDAFVASLMAGIPGADPPAENLVDQDSDSARSPWCQKVTGKK